MNERRNHPVERAYLEGSGDSLHSLYWRDLTDASDLGSDSVAFENEIHELPGAGASKLEGGNSSVHALAKRAQTGYGDGFDVVGSYPEIDLETEPTPSQRYLESLPDSTLAEIAEAIEHENITAAVLALDGHSPLHFNVDSAAMVVVNPETNESIEFDMNDLALALIPGYQERDELLRRGLNVTAMRAGLGRAKTQTLIALADLRNESTEPDGPEKAEEVDNG